MKRFSNDPRKYFSGLFTSSLCAVFVLVLFLYAPLPVYAGTDAAASNSGLVKGNNGLSAAWSIQKELPGKPKPVYEEGEWLAVEASLGGKLVQTVELNGVYQGLDGKSPLAVDDYNFDGHDDLYLYDGVNTRANYGTIFLFNPKTEKFEASEKLNALSVVSADKERKRLLCEWANSAFDSRSQEFVIKGFDEPQLVYEEGSETREDEQGKTQHIQFKRTYKDGKIISQEEKKQEPK